MQTFPIKDLKKLKKSKNNLNYNIILKKEEEEEKIEDVEFFIGNISKAKGLDVKKDYTFSYGILGSDG